MQQKEVMELMKLFASLRLTSMEWKTEDGTLVFTKERPGTAVAESTPTDTVQVAEPPAVQEMPTEEPVAAAEIPSTDRYVTAPLVGTFYLQASPGLPPFVNVGDRVQKGKTLCIIEAMKMMNEITAEIDGEIVEVLGENGQMVEYGQNLFRIRVS